MGSYTVISEGLNPITLTEAKNHLRAETCEEDRLINSQINAATKWAEHFTNRKFAQTVIRMDMNGFPSCIELELGPVQGITSIVYDDIDGAEQTLAADQYELDDRTVRPAYGVTWPSARSHWNSVRVTYGVGYYEGSPIAANLPDDIKAGVLLVVGDLYENRERQQDIQLYSNDAAEMLLSLHRIFEA